ncbi:hypothetical protein WUBG_04724, partial [Wuchereria bancrofti]
IQEQLNTHDDEQELRHFKGTITKLNGRYQVPWPWKDPKVCLNDNYGNCDNNARVQYQK